MLLFRALVATLFTVSDDSMAPTLRKGDRVMVSRWSYGLRSGRTGTPFAYGRICRRGVSRGDLVAFDTPDGVRIERCTHLPGDTLGGIVVPGLHSCADQDYYVIGRHTVAERHIIGRACAIVYSRDDSLPLCRTVDFARAALLP